MQELTESQLEVLRQGICMVRLGTDEAFTKEFCEITAKTAYEKYENNCNNEKHLFAALLILAMHHDDATYNKIREKLYTYPDDGDDEIIKNLCSEMDRLLDYTEVYDVIRWYR
jgi:hypothetical protein